MFLENYSDKALARIYNNNFERAIKTFKGTVLFLYLFFFFVFMPLFFFFLRHCRTAGGMYLIQLVMKKYARKREHRQTLSLTSRFYCLLFVYEIFFREKLRQILERCHADVERFVYPLVDLDVAHGDDHPGLPRGRRSDKVSAKIRTNGMRVFFLCVYRMTMAVI